MPTITTTVTSACASGVVTTQTTTEATPESGTSNREVELATAVLGAWAAGTLSKDVAKFYAADAVADFGSDVINLPQYKKYVGHAAIAEWLDGITADMDVTKFDMTFSAAKANAGKGAGCYIHVDWGLVIKATGKTFTSQDIIHYEFNSAGLATGMTMYWTNPKALEAAYATATDPVAAATKILDSWEAGTLTADIPTLFAEGAVADWGSGALSLPQYKKYSGHAELVEWLNTIDAELEFTKFDRSHSATASGDGCFIHVDWTVTVKATGKSVSSTDIIHYTFDGQGKATGITMYWTQPGVLEAAYSA